MSCFNTKVQLLNTKPTVSVQRLESSPEISIQKEDSITVEASLQNLQVKVNTKDLSSRLNIRCSVVCSIAELPYLRVTPTEVQWVTPDNDIIYYITSNTDWVVLKN